jgi:S-adenosylmethionine hydrolase
MAPFGLSKHYPSIVLLTDFGFRDSYVGVMKGVIRRICRGVDIIDLSHNIMPQDVAEAAFVLSASYRYFADDTIFVCVVDPGVGTERNVLYMRAGDQMFLAPDNGLLSVIAEEREPRDVRKVTAGAYFLKEESTTFHGRDIFAPVAAHLADGLEPEKLGSVFRGIHSLQLPRPVRCADGSLRGEIIYIDQFGNLITNIRRGTLERTFSTPSENVQVQVKRRVVQGILKTYAEQEAGELLALVGSSGYLEVAVNRGSAAMTLGCEKGDTVTVTEMEEVPSGG